METNLIQLKCGECGGESHKIYQRPNKELIISCLNCTSKTVVSMRQPEITLTPHEKSFGCLCNLD